MIEDIIFAFKSIFVEILPSVFVSILLFIFGWILAKIFSGLTSKTLEKLKIDEHIKLGKRIGFSEVVSLSVYWIIFFVFINASIENLGISSLSNYMHSLTDFIIKLFSGFLIIIVGYSISSFIQLKVVQTKISHAEIISQLIFFFSIIITIEMALKVIGLPTELMDAILLIIVASLGLGIAIAIGLGLKDFVSNWVKKYYKD
ncbi:MAG: hypothetical protein QXO84_03225 [Candidatus Aenigmatarchaeota archaeon]